MNTPLTASRDEWAEAYMDIAKLVIEGFETKAIRARLDAAQVPYDKEDKTIALLEKLLSKTGAAGEFRSWSACGLSSSCAQRPRDMPAEVRPSSWRRML